MNKIIVILIILILIVGNIFFGVKYFLTQGSLDKLVVVNASNKGIAEFNKLFVNDVLKTQGEVSYENRLKLEEAVLNTKDNDIINAWQAFLNSSTQQDAEENVKILLSLFPEKLIF